ncbi:hypothetical protein EJ08DRAFT_720189, partial [Tothia fuscella]
KLKAAFNAFTVSGVVHGDPVLHNLLWDGNQVMVIDWDCSEITTIEEASERNSADYRAIEKRLLGDSL